MLIIATRENVGMRQWVQCFLFKHKVLSSNPQQSCKREVHGIHVYVYYMYVCVLYPQQRRQRQANPGPLC